ncbi:MAG: LLM class flavin-dependent oxidoreductase [Cryobacterium sp.]|nr:LLM class flavin-dependent oxidoreductase [Cryobacterium sp.]
MVSYGQELKFGTFITPTSSDPERVIELAVASDRLGFDLASFQDHPYQPALLDAWSLIAFVAARTERISLSANVSNLPLRLPVLLARASATIDLLSNGRLELGIGAGGFWDAIEAVGGRRLEPGQAVEALGEAIQIIRELWNPDAPGPARFEGKFYSVSEAKRGPRTPHSIGIQIGAYKPKMLHLTGRLADGWIPSFGYLKSIESLAAMNAAVDEGALLGRNPSEVRLGDKHRVPMKRRSKRWPGWRRTTALADSSSVPTRSLSLKPSWRSESRNSDRGFRRGRARSNPRPLVESLRL